MRRIDHEAKAMWLRDMAGDTTDQTHQANLIAAAQVHATIALVEQQRIDNLIALENQRWERHCQVGAYFGPDILRGNPTTEFGSAELKHEIAAALGIDLNGEDDDE